MEERVIERRHLFMLFFFSNVFIVLQRIKTLFTFGFFFHYSRKRGITNRYRFKQQLQMSSFSDIRHINVAELRVKSLSTHKLLLRDLNELLQCRLNSTCDSLITTLSRQLSLFMH